MSSRIVIQHVTGSKANRIEHLTLEGLREITLGRDSTSNIRFDEQGDDAVSRRHASIRVQTEPALGFWIADLGSRNGTRVNDEPVTSETELLPGDTVELGKGGPRFVFDLQPRPAHFAGRTKVISIGSAAPTRTLDTASIEAAARAAASTSEKARNRPPSASGISTSNIDQRRSGAYHTPVWTAERPGSAATSGCG